MKWLPLSPLFYEMKPSVSLPQPLQRMNLPFCTKMADLLPERYPFTSVSLPVFISLITPVSAILLSFSGTILCQYAGMHKTSNSSQSSPRYFNAYLYFNALMTASEVLSSTISSAYTTSVADSILSKCTTCSGRRQKCSEFFYIIIITKSQQSPEPAFIAACDNFSYMNKAIEDYILQEKIGSGQYGNVYRAQHKKTKLHYAVKVMSTDKFKQTPKLTEFTNNQINILSKISHPNIIKFVQMLCTPSNYYLVYQYCNGGTLAEYIKRKGRLSEEEALKILEQLRAAFEALYQAHILHRDLKPTNILFNNGAIKLADFGFCKELLKQQDMAQTMVGSPIYMAPEVLKGLVYDSRADLWSLGVILYEMLFGSCPYEESSIPKLITLIDSHYLKIPAEPAISQTVKQLLLRLLTLKYRERITPTEFIRYDFGKILLQPPRNSENTVVSFKQAGKYIRRALIYLSESLQLVTREVDDIVFLRLAFMLYKTISYIMKDTLSGGVYWQNLSISNRSTEWQAVTSQELAILRPYGELAREALVREDSSLKTKVELETTYVDSKYFLENIKRVDQDEIRMKLLNCFIFNKHFTMVVEKRPPEWTDPTSDGLSIKEKEQLCAKFARYY